jgi:predicted dehydrogenase
MKRLLDSVREPKALMMTVNAGAIPQGHRTQDPAVGGGRIVGEGCHFVDLLRFLTGSRVVAVQAVGMGPVSGVTVREDKVSFNLSFEDGSFGTVHYLANGHKSFPKERLEVFCAGRILQLDNFRKLSGFGWPRFKRMNLWRQDKGQAACVAAFVKAVESGSFSPIPFDELVETTRVTLAVRRAMETGSAVRLHGARTIPHEEPGTNR